MPLIDVSDVLFDPDFRDDSLIVTRYKQTLDSDGFVVNGDSSVQFSGVVTIDRALEARRMESGEVISGAILVITHERLSQGDSHRDADIVTYRGRDYRVTFVDDYSAYGNGFVQAHCELLIGGGNAK